MASAKVKRPAKTPQRAKRGAAPPAPALPSPVLPAPVLPGVSAAAPRGIGTLREYALHAELKRRLAEAGDVFEAPVRGYVIDIRRADTLIEIQTRGLGAMRAKLLALLEHHPIRVVHPVPARKWIVRVDGDGVILGRRRSPKIGRLEDIFRELVSIPDFVGHPNLTLAVALTHEDELWQPSTGRAWRRRGWRVGGRQLLAIERVVAFTCAADFAALLPAGLARPFAARDLAQAARIDLRLAYQMIYCLRRMGALAAVAKRGRAALYDAPPPALPAPVAPA